MKSEVLKYVINNDNNDLLEKDLEIYRRLCVSGALLVPAFWIVHKSINPNIIDFITPRLVLSVLFILIFIGSYINNYIKSNIVNFMGIVYYLLTILLIYLNFINDFSDHFLGLIITCFAITVLGLKKQKHLILYNFSILILTSLACLLADNPQIDKSLLISNFASVSLISYIVSRASIKNQEEIAIREQLMTTIFDESADALFLVAPTTQKIITCNARATIFYEEEKKRIKRKQYKRPKKT